MSNKKRGIDREYVRGWWSTLTPEQRAAVKAGLPPERNRVGWTVYMYPTVGPPTHIELRYRSLDGRLIRTIPVWPQ